MYQEVSKIYRLNSSKHIFLSLCTRTKSWDSNPRVQSTVDEQSVALTTRTPRLTAGVMLEHKLRLKCKMSMIWRVWFTLRLNVLL